MKTDDGILFSGFGYTCSPARYARGKVALRIAPDGEFKSRGQRLASDGLNARWSNRCRAYLMSPTRAELWLRLYQRGFDCAIRWTRRDPPFFTLEGHSRMSEREARAFVSRMP